MGLRNRYVSESFSKEMLIMTAKDYLNYVVKKIHTTVVATVDDEGLPVTAAIDMMDTDGDSLYFLTAKGKGFYDRLIKQQFLAFTAMKGEDTMSSVAVSVRGKVRELGHDKIPELFDKNPYMHEIYPTEEAMKALTVFQIYEGSGEWFDLSKKPIERDSFTFGGTEKSRKDILLPMPVLDAETAQQYARKIASLPLTFHM